MYALDIVEPRTCVLLSHKFVIQAFLSEVLKHNFPTLDSSVGGLDSAIFATAEAISLYVSLIAAYALPEYVMGRKSNI